jgi:hypothetical protein
LAINAGKTPSWATTGPRAIYATMRDADLDAINAELKRLAARIAALEKLLERIIRQKPVSEKQLDQVLRSRGVAPPGIRR